MNILILTTHLNTGGISRYVTNLARGLSLSNNVWIGSCGGKWAGELSAAGVRYKTVPINTKSILSPKIFLSLLILIPLVIKEKIDIIHANTRVTQFLAFLLHKACGRSYVSTFHGFYRRHIFRRLFFFEGALSIAVSGAVAEHIKTDMGVKKEKINVVYNGISPDDFKKRRREASRRQGKGCGVKLGILGRLSAEKGHILTLRALNLLRAKYSDISLLISGEGKLKEKLKEEVESAGLNDYVSFVSLAAQEFLDLIDILVVASSKEGFGYSILEAFAKDVVVVAFSTGGIKEIVKAGENGLLFYDYTPKSLAQAIEKLIAGDSLRQSLVAKARLSLEKFSLDAMVKQTEAVYKKAMAL
ncbi:MAG: glycosyltransferase family 4 protein [Candidatus Omnitrophota bacterium]